MKKFYFGMDDDRVIGRFTKNSAREILNNQFRHLYLTSDAVNFLARELEDGGVINGNKFNNIVNQARKRGYITAEKAEKIKDEAKLPDNMNEHWTG